MAKSEYYQPRTIEGEKEQPQLLVDAMEIYGLLLRAEMMMTKVDRIRYATRAIEQIQDVIKEFYLAYDFEEDRLVHLRRLCANVGLFLITMRIIAERNCISCVPAARFGEMTPDGVKRGLMERVARLDEGATKWRRSLTRIRREGKTGAQVGDPAVP